MKNNILPFIKKYPMSILLAIIALNLLSIARSLRTEAELNSHKLTCIQYRSNQIDFNEAGTKLKVSDPNFTNVNRACNAISSF